MEDQNDSGIERQNLSVLVKRYIVAGIIFLSLLIGILVAFIAEAYINQHPVFEFLRYAVFKPETVFWGSISLVILYIGILVLGIAACLVMILEFVWKNILLIPIIISLVLIFISLQLSYSSYDWQLSYSTYNYVGFILLLFGILGKMTTLTVTYIKNKKELFKNIANKLDAPFTILFFVGFFLIFYANILSQ